MLRKRHILIVDDDVFLREFLSAALTERGYLALTAGNGLEAQEIIANIQLSAVITDIFMPEMDGIELIQTLRKQHPEILLFALSGGTYLGRKDEYLKAAKTFGACEVLTKPVEPEELLARLEPYFQDDAEGPTRKS